METDVDCYGNHGGYCTPDDVSEILGILDPVTNEPLIFTDKTYPTNDAVWKRIQAESDKFDNQTHDTWQVKRVENLIFDRGTQWSLNNMYIYGPPLYEGGWQSPLSADMLEWSPELGDKLEKRTFQNTWVDISDEYGKTFWFDQQNGYFYCTQGFTLIQNAFRITYRYGKTTPVPADVRDAIAKKVAIWILQTDIYRSSVGQGQGLPNKDTLINSWKEDIKETIANRFNMVTGVSAW